MAITLFTSFDAAAKAIVAGEVTLLGAEVRMYSDIVARDVVYYGEMVSRERDYVTFKPDSARCSHQYGYPNR